MDIIIGLAVWGLIIGLALFLGQILLTIIFGAIALIIGGIGFVLTAVWEKIKS